MKNIATILLLNTMVSTSFIFASEAQEPAINHTDYTQQLSSLLEQAKQQCAWNRETKNDYHVQTPQILGKKLYINVPQTVHLAGMILSLASLDPVTISTTSGKIGIGVRSQNINVWNIPLLLICAYRYIAGEQKIPAKIVD